VKIRYSGIDIVGEPLVDVIVAGCVAVYSLFYY
jgi:hypothetical protein